MGESPSTNGGIAFQRLIPALRGLAHNGRALGVVAFNANGDAVAIERALHQGQRHLVLAVLHRALGLLVGFVHLGEQKRGKLRDGQAGQKQQRATAQPDPGVCAHGEFVPPLVAPYPLEQYQVQNNLVA